VTDASKLQRDKDIIGILDNLESRLAKIEAHLGLESEQGYIKKKEESQSVESAEAVSERMEINIGENWFAKVGIVILAIGIAFLLTFPYKDLPASIPIVIGYTLVAGLVVISHVWKDSFTLLSRYLLGGSLLLLYFTTLRLYYFSSNPLLTNHIIELALLIFVVSINLYVSLRRNSVYLCSISLTLGYITASIGGSPLIQFTLTTVLAVIVVVFYLKYKWFSILVYGMFLTGLTHFHWFINNPLLGNRIELASSPYFNIYLIFLYILLFSLAIYRRPKETNEENKISVSLFLGSFGFYGLFLILTLTKFQDHLALDHFLISVLFLALAFLFWNKEKSKYATFFYAISGYTALSVSILAQFPIPDSFVWLSWQSLLVISTAIWFRSKFIVLANFIIFTIIFIAYLFLEGTVDLVSLSFGIVALVSARILNWKKERLELKTELMRNSYLTAAFIMFPYALYHAVPAGYVSLSWVGVAGLYYLLSIILKNKKYRWMALLTFILTALYLLLIGTINFDPVFRLISFIVLGSALIIVSLLYTKFKNKSQKQNSSQS
jgi:uncharacterized membrane protein